MIIKYGKKNIEVPYNVVDKYMSNKTKEKILIAYELYNYVVNRPENATKTEMIKKFHHVCTVPNINLSFRRLQNIWMDTQRTIPTVNHEST